MRMIDLNKINKFITFINILWDPYVSLIGNMKVFKKSKHVTHENIKLKKPETEPPGTLNNISLHKLISSPLFSI